MRAILLALFAATAIVLPAKAEDVTGMERQGARVTAALTASGQRIEAETFVNADSNFHDMFCAGVSTLENGTIVCWGDNQSGQLGTTRDCWERPHKSSEHAGACWKRGDEIS